ncbi:MAG TPA: hypothetical protein EYP18_00125, partial [Desulfobacterales bacterium]|nr:hypothetical protein [Desulfobacterales bacterium]
LKNLGSVKRIRKASIEELEAVPGIGSSTALIIHTHFQKK